jgi:hypothetical protein
MFSKYNLNAWNTAAFSNLLRYRDSIRSRSVTRIPARADFGFYLSKLKRSSVILWRLLSNVA